MVIEWNVYYLTYIMFIYMCAFLDNDLYLQSLQLIKHVTNQDWLKVWMLYTLTT